MQSRSEPQGTPYAGGAPSSLTLHGDPRVREMVEGKGNQQMSPVVETVWGIIQLPSAAIELTAYSIKDIMFTRESAAVLLHFTGAIVTGWVLNHQVGTDFNPSALYDTSQWIFLSGIVWLLFDWLSMHILDRGVLSPFDGPTLFPRTQLYRNPNESEDDNFMKRMALYFYVKGYRNNQRFVLQIPVLVFGCGCLALWRRLAEVDDPSTQAEYGRVIDQLRTIHTLTMLWIVLVPSLATGVIEYKSTHERPDGDGFLTVWSLMALILKGMLLVVSYVLMDPVQTSLWDHRAGQPVNVAEKVIISTIGTMATMASMMFFTRYAREHHGFGDRLFAFTDNASTLSLIMLLVWQYTARMQGNHVPSDREILPMMFALQVHFFLYQIVATQSVPPHVYHVELDTPNEDQLLAETKGNNL